MNEEVLILSASKYDFTDERTNKKLTGLTVWLCPVKTSIKENLNGIKPVKYSLPEDKMHVFDGVNLPAYGVMHFEFDFSSSKIMPGAFSDFTEFEMGAI